MLEERNYILEELEEELKVSGRQNLKEKLNRWEVEYEVIGRGHSAVFQIKKIKNLFKIFCIQELGVSPQTNFNSFCYFVYKYLSDDDFATIPMDAISERMKKRGYSVHRTTISKWRNVINKSCGIVAGQKKYHLLKTVNGERITKPITKEEYSAFWRKFFEGIELGKTKNEAIGIAKFCYGGNVYKADTPMIFPWDTKNIEKRSKLIELAAEQLRVLENIEANT